MRGVLVGVMVAAMAVAAIPVIAASSQQIPPADQWVDHPALAPACTDPVQRAQMNAEIVQAILAADGDEDAARQAIARIAARYQEAAQAQGARTRPGPK
jgi:hypothetical protein